MQPNILKETVKGVNPISLEDSLLSERNIFLLDPVDRKSTSSLIKQLMYLEKESPGEPITLYINSPGGEVVSGLALYDYIKLISSPVNTVCIGTAASMGAILFLAGKERKMLKHSEIMIHDPSFAAGNIGGQKPHELEEKLKGLMKTRDTLVGIIAERTGLTLKQVYRKTRIDTTIGAEEALEYGIATEIIERRKDNEK